MCLKACRYCRRPHLFCIFFFSLFLSFPFSSNTFAQSKYGGNLVLATSSDPRSFNGMLAKEASTSDVLAYIFEGLTTVDAFTARVKPHLAQNWEVSEDGKTWTFHLREDVLWQDGKPFTADDVIFTFNDLIYNPDIPSSAADIFTIEGKPFQVEKLDNHTVRFTLPTKFAPFLRAMGQSIYPKHKLEKFVQKGSFNTAWGIDTEPEEIIGTGPFRLVGYDPGQRIVYERNPLYWMKSGDGESLPYLDGVVMLIVQNLDIELLKFLEGTTDIYGLRGMDYPIFKPREEEGRFTVYELGPQTGSNFLTFNQNPGVNPNTGEHFIEPHKFKWFHDLNFRRAVAHAIDKEQIINIVKNGLGYPQYSPIGPGAGFFHNPDVKKYDYDLDKARKILERAGFQDRDGDGYLEDREGNPVEFSLYTNADNTERLDIAAIIRQDLENLGMKVNFQGVAFNTLVSRLNSTFDWDAIVLGLTGGVEPHFGKNVWTSSGQLHLWHPRQETPATAWEARVDEIFNLGVQELDEDKRKILYDEFQTIISEKLPLIYTVLSSRVVAVRNKFGNLKPSNLYGVLHNIEEIYVKEGWR